MNKSILVVLCAAIAAALLFVALWPERTRGAAAVPRAPQASESVVAASPAGLPEPELRREEAPSALEPVPVPPPATSEIPSVPVESTEGSADAVLKMLADPAFVDACARLSETDAQTLIDLESRAQNVLSAYQGEECQRRIEAGLYERIEGYKPGEPFTTTSRNNKGEIVSYSFSDGEARRIEFTPEEYPHMHTLKARIRAFRLERSSRDRGAR